MRSVLALILGGGQGSRLFPLTQLRSKPAVPIGGKYRLIDVPISNCLHADIRRIYVLTQFNSASLNRHVNLTYHMDQFSSGFVEILAAEQTPESAALVRGHGRRRSQSAPPFRGASCGPLPDSRRRSSLPHGLHGAPRRASRAQGRHHHCRPALHRRQTPRPWGSSRFDPGGPDHRVRGKTQRAPG